MMVEIQTCLFSSKYKQNHLCINNTQWLLHKTRGDLTNDEGLSEAAFLTGKRWAE